MKIVCIGDSLTFGYGVNQNESWFSNVSEELRSIEFVNKGIPGNTTKEMLLRFEKDVVEYLPTHVLIMGGTNDVLMGYEIDGVINRIIQMINISKLNGVVPILIIQPPIDENVKEKKWFLNCDYKFANKMLGKYRTNVIKEITSSKTSYFDIYGKFNELVKSNKEDKYYIDDGIHLTKEAHKYISDEIINGLKQIIL